MTGAIMNDADELINELREQLEDLETTHSSMVSARDLTIAHLRAQLAAVTRERDELLNAVESIAEARKNLHASMIGDSIINVQVGMFAEGRARAALDAIRAQKP